MDDEANFFAMPPSEAPPAPAPEGGEAPILLGDAGEMPDDAGGFTLLGEAPAPAAYVGDIDETQGDGGMGFAAAPDSGYQAADSGYQAPDGGYEAPSDDVYQAPPDGGYEAPPSDQPIILGGGPPVEDAPVAAPESTEPSPMQKWNEEWQETLKQRKDEENEMKSDLVEKARLAMEKFQQDREARREAKMAKNREDEQAKLEAIEADLENDNSWQRVCKLVDLSHDGAQNAQDVKRMRDAMILLKNEPTRAALLA